MLLTSHSAKDRPHNKCLSRLNVRCAKAEKPWYKDFVGYKKPDLKREKKKGKLKFIKIKKYNTHFSKDTLREKKAIQRLGRKYTLYRPEEGPDFKNIKNS